VPKYNNIFSVFAVFFSHKP